MVDKGSEVWPLQETLASLYTHSHSGSQDFGMTTFQKISYIVESKHTVIQMHFHVGRTHWPARPSSSKRKDKHESPLQFIALVLWFRSFLIFLPALLRFLFYHSPLCQQTNVVVPANTVSKMTVKDYTPQNVNEVTENTVRGIWDSHSLTVLETQTTTSRSTFLQTEAAILTAILQCSKHFSIFLHVFLTDFCVT